MGRWLRAIWHWFQPPHVVFWLADGGGLAGQWEVWPPPRAPGRHRYSLFRSVFHAHLHRQVAATGSVWVAYRFRGEEVRCRVVGSPGPGLLEVAEAVSGPIPAEPGAAADPAPRAGPGR